MSITPLPDPPKRTEPSTFSDKADAFVAALPQFANEANAQAAQVNSNTQAAASSAVSASVSANQASQFANEAAQQAFIAQSAANFRGFWASQTNYARGDTVAFDGERYVALRASQGQVPNISGLDWLLITQVANIRTPTPIAPLSGASGVSPAVVLEASPYAPIHSADLRVERQFQVALSSDVGFSAPVFTSNVNADSVTVSPNLATETAFRWRCRDRTTIDGADVFSDWMQPQAFTTADVSIAVPTLTVTGGPDDVPETPTITTSAFATIPAGQDTHESTSWTIRRVSDNALVWSALNNTTNLLSIDVPAGVLEPDTAYRFQARHNGAELGQGPLGEVQATTLAEFDIVPLLAVAHNSSPFVTIYNQEIDTFTRLPNPAQLPTGIGRGVAFSSDDTYMAVAHDISPFITIYKRSGDTFTALPNPAQLPTGTTGLGVAFSSDDTYMAVGHDGSPRITIYKRSGDTFTRLPNPSQLPAGTGRGVAFSNTGFPQ